MLVEQVIAVEDATRPVFLSHPRTKLQRISVRDAYAKHVKASNITQVVFPLAQASEEKKEHAETIEVTGQNGSFVNTLPDGHRPRPQHSLALDIQYTLITDDHDDDDEADRKHALGKHAHSIDDGDATSQQKLAAPKINYDIRSG